MPEIPEEAKAAMDATTLETVRPDPVPPALMPAFRVLDAAASSVAVLAFGVVFGLFLLQVVSRYVFNAPITWTGEAIMIAFIWTFFWAIAFVVPLPSHISFDLVHQLVGPRTKRVFDVLSLGATVVLFAMALPATLDFVTFMFKQPTSALGIPFGYVYYAFPVAMTGYALRALLRIARLVGPTWRDHL